MNAPRKSQPFGFLPLALLCLVFLLIGAGIWASSKSAVHEIEGLAALFVSAILLVGAVLAFGIGNLRKELWSYSIGMKAQDMRQNEP